MRTGLLALGLLAMGCGASRPLTVVEPFRAPAELRPAEALARYQEYCAGLRSFSAAGDLEVKDLKAARVRRLGVRLVAARPGRLYVKGSVAVVTALEVVADGRRFWFQVPSKKKVWTGAEGGAPRSAGTDAPYEALRPADVVAALLPEPVPAGAHLLWEADRATLALTELRDAGEGLRPGRRIVFERESLRPLRLLFYDAAGDLVTEARLGAWRGELPGDVTLLRREGYEARLTFDRAERNVEAPDKLFEPRIPQGFETVEVTS